MALPMNHWMLNIIFGIVCAYDITHVAASNAEVYTANAVEAIKTLNDWYSVSTGLWENAWWNSANALTTIADFASLRLDEANKLNIGGFIRNTFAQAQKTNVLRSSFPPVSDVVSNIRNLTLGSGCTPEGNRLGKRGFGQFLNDYYDDEGWWALGFIRSYDVSGEEKYLAAAVNIFKDMQTGGETPCRGGIFWSKDRHYVNAIANELYLSVAASLARRVPENNTYRPLAIAQWRWFEKSGLINAKGLINDGLNGNCMNNGLQTWSYNQGVVLGGLTELFLLTLDTQYLERATEIAKVAIKALSDKNGILTETDKCETEVGRCRPTSQQFKGVFVRNLGYLYRATPLQEFRDFIFRNADSIWTRDRNDKNQLGVAWAGDYTDATASTQSSALDVLIAAIAVA
ncbi:hypothetical protein ED733_003061 [Metarhizium rileyi]|uniref:Glycosyl hydrolase n=1 Tax=Metarhizium rileyi (strain RCEF 4871) TaxID=1649241 RepID=A0A5C6G670_METRR|nr:hypothetical protein ED733_003061 [Metarhizium rileyi]